MTLLTVYFQKVHWVAFKLLAYLQFYSTTTWYLICLRFRSILFKRQILPRNLGQEQAGQCKLDFRRREYVHLDFLVFLLVQFAIFFFDLFKSQITGGNSQCLSHHCPDISGKEFGVLNLCLAGGVNWKIFQLGSLKQLSHCQPDDGFGSMRLFPSPEIKTINVSIDASIQ